MFREVPRQFDFPAAEQEIRRFWEERGIYQKSLEQRRGGPPFVFYEGPPTANGLPHPGHCLTRAIKDLFPRYRTMTGYYCERKAGWDTHGLPVEVEVCKELKLQDGTPVRTKAQIDQYDQENGFGSFNRKCLESVFRYTKEWETLTRRLGFWVNLEEAYVTYHQSYVESVWWALKTLFDAGLLYQGHKIVWWWAQGGTALSSGEVGQGYREVDDPSVYVRFPVVMDERAKVAGIPEKTSLLVWTTTPWTLPSNMFAAVNKDFDYAIVLDETTGERLIFAAALVETIAKKAKAESWKVERTVKGAELVGVRYVPPFRECFYNRGCPEDAAVTMADWRPPAQLNAARRLGHFAWTVEAASFVTLDSGSGLVHEAPAFGEVDYQLWRERVSDSFAAPFNEVLLCAVAPSGEFTSDAPAKYRGRWVKECDKDLVRDMKERKAYEGSDIPVLLHQELYRHDYPFCWRAEEDPLIQYPRRSWFIRTTQFKDDMLANNQQINWLPEHIKAGRFGKFLESNVDWALSRERYWGTPLPIWVCEKTGKMESIGSYAELLAQPDVRGTDVWDRDKAADPALSEHLKVHKPYIDAVTYQSPFDPAARMKRVPDVIDCWFDSGAMPFAQWGYPHAPGSVERFKTNFPADFISEALDQTRGWFYSLVAISTLLFGKHGAGNKVQLKSTTDWPQPFRNCIVLGLLLGEDGLKMSKSKKNYKEPSYIFDHEGADAMRWLMFSGQPPWTSIRFQESAIAEAQREFLIRLFNVYSFFVIYANIDGWTPTGGLAGRENPAGPPPGASELDRWILSELHGTIRDVRAAMDAYDNFTAAKSLSRFVDALSNWYVRRSRDRYWKAGMDADKAAAYAVLYDCLVTTVLLAAPFTPFFSDAVYQNLVGSRVACTTTALGCDDDTMGGPAASGREGAVRGESGNQGTAGGSYGTGNTAGGGCGTGTAGGGWCTFPESVHLCDYPVAQPGLIDDKFSTEMAIVRSIVSLGRAARAEAKIKVRQPLALVEIVLADKSHTEWLRNHAELICDELNVKAVEFTSEADHYVNYQVKPNFKSIGPKFGKLGPAIKQALARVADPAAMRRQIDATGRASLTVDGQTIELTTDDVQIDLSAKPGWAAAQDGTAVVVLKTEISDALKSEGLARELAHHIQQLRKELDLEYTRRIELSIAGDPQLVEVARQFEAYLRGETLAESLTLGRVEGAESHQVDVDGLTAELGVKPR